MLGEDRSKTAFCKNRGRDFVAEARGDRAGGTKLGRRSDPLASMWDSEIVPTLEAAPGIRAVAIFEEACRRDLGFAPGVRRTLERRIAKWRALNGPNPDVIFRQEHPPGRMGLSEFTDIGALGITIAGAFRSSALPLPAGVLGLRVLWTLGGVPEQHRSDSLSVAASRTRTARLRAPMGT